MADIASHSLFGVTYRRVGAIRTISALGVTFAIVGNRFGLVRA